MAAYCLNWPIIQLRKHLNKISYSIIPATYFKVSHSVSIFIISCLVLSGSVTQKVVVGHNLEICNNRLFLPIFPEKTVSPIFMKFSGIVDHVERSLCANFCDQQTLITCLILDLKNHDFSKLLLSYTEGAGKHTFHVLETTSPALPAL